MQRVKLIQATLDGHAPPLGKFHMLVNLNLENIVIFFSKIRLTKKGNSTWHDKKISRGGMVIKNEKLLEATVVYVMIFCGLFPTRSFLAD